MREGFSSLAQTPFFLIYVIVRARTIVGASCQGEYDWSTVKLGVKIEKNDHLCFLSLKTSFCYLKLKLPFQPFIDT